MRRLRVAAAAKQDLADIAAYTTEQWGSVQARRYMLNLKSLFQRLLEYPGLGVARHDLGKRLRSIVGGSHIVFYADDGVVVEVVRVLHHALDVGQTLRREPFRPLKR